MSTLGGKKKTAIDKILKAAASGGSFSRGDLETAISGLNSIIEKTSGDIEKVLEKEKKNKEETGLEPSEVSGGADTLTYDKIYNPGTGPGYSDDFTTLKQSIDDSATKNFSSKAFLDLVKKAQTLEYDSRYAKGHKDDFVGQSRLQALIQHSLGSLANPQLALHYLNELQRKVPFMIADPRPQTIPSMIAGGGEKTSGGDRRSKTTGGKLVKKIKYGYADLFRFMGHPFGPGMLRSKENPWYHPIRYPIPDHSANMAMLNLLASNSHSRLAKLKEISKKSKKSHFSPKDDEYGFIVGAIQEIIADRYDPDKVLIPIPGQERPMATYRLNNIHRLLANMNLAHEIYGPLGFSKDGMVDIEVSNPEKSGSIARGGGGKRKERKGKKKKDKRRSSNRDDDEKIIPEI